MNVSNDSIIFYKWRLTAVKIFQLQLEAIQFFKEQFEYIDAFAEEISYCNDRVEEVMYKVNDPHHSLPEPYLAHLEILRCTFFPETPLSEVSAFSYQVADGNAYAEDKIMLLLKTAEQDKTKYPEIECHAPLPDYCVNFMLDSGTYLRKFYEDFHPSATPFVLPKDFKGARIEERFGIGRGVNPDIIGIYFYHQDMQAAADYLGLPCPAPEFAVNTGEDKLFGLTYNVKTNQPIKLVYYFYPNRHRLNRR